MWGVIWQREKSSGGRLRIKRLSQRNSDASSNVGSFLGRALMGCDKVIIIMKRKEKNACL